MSSDIIALGAVIVSAMGAVFGLYQARKADKSANTVKTVEIGVTTLIDQYQETNRDLREQVNQYTSKCNLLEQKVNELTRKVDNLETIIDAKDAEILRLKRELGEPLI